MPPRVFTLSDANDLIPLVAPRVRRMVDARNAARGAEAVLDRFRTRAAMEGGVLPEQDLSGAKAEVDRLQAEIRTLVSEIEALGAIVKDVDQGLVDFLSIRQGQHVFLCWRLGEPAIRFWHGLEEGFAGRQPIDSSD
jgi:hypothetical protein